VVTEVVTEDDGESPCSLIGIGLCFTVAEGEVLCFQKSARDGICYKAQQYLKVIPSSKVDTQACRHLLVLRGLR